MLLAAQTEYAPATISSFLHCALTLIERFCVKCLNFRKYTYIHDCLTGFFFFYEAEKSICLHLWDGMETEIMNKSLLRSKPAYNFRVYVFYFARWKIIFHRAVRMFRIRIRPQGLEFVVWYKDDLAGAASKSLGQFYCQRIEFIRFV